MVFTNNSGEQTTCKADILSVNDQSIAIHISTDNPNEVVSALRNGRFEPICGYEQYQVFRSAVVSESDGVAVLDAIQGENNET